MAHLIAPSILSSDFSILGKVVDMLNKSAADWIHVDVMDGLFVPNISFGFPIVKAIKKHSTKPLDVHLMIVDPHRYISPFKDAGANNLIVHLEACRHLHRTISAIKEEGMQASVAINPHTAVSQLEAIIRDIDNVVIMSVNPGFGGQKFIEHTYKKIELIRNLIEKTGANTKIEIDGGVDLNNAQKLLDVGAHILVAGSFIFESMNPARTIHKLKMLKQQN